MTYKEKLIELLKEVPEVKKDLEELRFGTLVKDKIGKSNLIILKGFSSSNKMIMSEEEYNYGYSGRGENDFNIIGNPLEERHLRMYCENNNKKDIAFFLYELCELIPQKETGFHFSTICKIDNTKSFDKQEDKIYEKIFNYLTK